MANRRNELLDSDLEVLLSRVIGPGTVLRTVHSGRPNTVEEIGSEGLRVATHRSMTAGKTELVPAWMFNRAWHQLRQEGHLEARELVKSVKRSSAVCAALAALPEVTIASTRPIRLEVHGGEAPPSP